MYVVSDRLNRNTEIRFVLDRLKFLITQGYESDRSKKCPLIFHG